MSRFFHGDSSSESSSSDEEELYSEEEEEQSEEESEEDSEDSSSSGDEKDNVTGAKRFIKGESSDEESDTEDVRVVKSAKDKRLEEVEGTVKLIENAEKINDWAVISAGKYFGLYPHIALSVVVTRH
jgi:translation initiation factor 3 subunit C